MWCSGCRDDKGLEVRSTGRADKCFSVQAKSKILSNEFPPNDFLATPFFLIFFTLSVFKNVFIYLFYFTTLIFCNHQEYLTNRVSHSVIKTFGNFYSKKLEIASLLIFTPPPPAKHSNCIGHD